MSPWRWLLRVVSHDVASADEALVASLLADVASLQRFLQAREVDLNRRLLQLADESPVRGRVTLVEHLGHETLVHLRVGETPVVVRTQADAAAPVVGAEVGLDVPVMHRHRFDAVSGRRIDT
jgi:multiple sugar transport system ATP-binding protein